MENFRKQSENILNIENQIFKTLIGFIENDVTDDGILKEFIKNDKLCKEIRYNFVGFKYQYIENLVTKHECNKPYSTPKHNSLPLPQTKNYDVIDGRKTRSLPRRITRISSNSMGCEFSRTPKSVTSSISELELGHSISSLALNSYCSEATDLKLLTPAVLCAHLPVLAQQQNKDLWNTDDILLNLNTSKLSEKLSSYVCQLFSLSKQDYNEYKTVILSDSIKSTNSRSTPSNDLGKKLQVHFFKQLQTLEKDETPYYIKDNFQCCEDYESWKRLERENLVQLLGNNGIELNKLEQTSENWKLNEYKALLFKMIEYDATNKTIDQNRRRHHSSGESIFRNDHVTLLGPLAHRLLAEFALRYRINDVTQVVTYVEVIGECIEMDLIELGDFKVLKKTSRLLKSLLNLLEVNENLILKSEKEKVISCIVSLTDDIKRLMCTFLFEWKPTNEQLEVTLLLLDSCYELRRRFNCDVIDDYPECVQNWFEKAVRDDYLKHKYLPCGCDPFKNSESASVLRAVVHSINNVQKGSDVEYRNIFGSYVPDVTKVTAKILYNLVIEDICQLRQNESLNRGTKPRSEDDLELEDRASFILAFKVAEFEYSVQEAGFEPEFMGLSWRRTYHRMTSHWMTSLSKIMTKIVNSCVINSKDICIPTDDVIKTNHVTTSHDDVQESTAVLHEQSCSYHKESLSREAEKEKGELEAKCSSSVVQFIILLHRFIDLISQVVESVYSIPPKMDHHTASLIQKQKDSFSIKVFEVVGDLVEQYCDCVINFDLCLFSKTATTFIMPTSKHTDLKTKLQNRMLPGCRHQFMKRCEDKIEDIYSDKGVFSDMAKRINNVSFLSENVKLISERLLRALNVALNTSENHSTLPSYSTDNICEDVFVSRPATSTESLASDESQATVVANPASSRNSVSTLTSQSSTVDVTERHSYENVSIVIRNPNDDVTQTSRHDYENVIIKDQNNNSDDTNTPPRDDNVIYIKRDVTRKRSNTAPILSSGTSLMLKPDHVITYSDDEVTRQRSSTVGNFPIADLSIRDITLKQEMAKIKQTTQDCVIYLSRMLSFRFYSYIRDTQIQIIHNPKLPLEITQTSQSRDIEACKNHCEPLTSLIQKTLATFEKFLYFGTLRHSYIALWELLVKELKSQVKFLKNQEKFSKPNAFVLLMTFRMTLGIMTSNDVIKADDVDEDDLQVTLNLLELYVTPTKKLINLHNKIVEQNTTLSLSRNGAKTTSLIRRSMKQKSFTGKELHEKAVKLLGGENRSNVKLEAFEYCTELLRSKQIHFLFIQNLNFDKMPSLEDYLDPSQESSLESSWQSRDESSNQSSDGFSSFPETDSDGGRSSEVSNQFMADINHYYRFGVQSNDLALYKTMDNLQSDVDQNLKDILETRKRVDPIALKFIKNKTPSWFHIFPCLG